MLRVKAVSVPEHALLACYLTVAQLRRAATVASADASLTVGCLSAGPPTLECPRDVQPPGPPTPEDGIPFQPLFTLTLLFVTAAFVALDRSGDIVNADIGFAALGLARRRTRTRDQRS